MTASFAAGPPGLLRSLNVRAVLETVAQGGQLTRAEVAWLRVVSEWFDDEAERLDRELAAA